MKLFMTLTISAIATSSAVATVQRVHPKGRLGMRRVTAYRRDCPEGGCIKSGVPTQETYGSLGYNSLINSKAVVKRKGDMNSNDENSNNNDENSNNNDKNSNSNDKNSNSNNENSNSNDKNSNSNSSNKHVVNYAAKIDNGNGNSKGSGEKSEDQNDNENDDYDSDSDTEGTNDTKGKGRGNHNSSSSSSSSKSMYVANFVANANGNQNEQVNGGKGNSNSSSDENDTEEVNDTNDTKGKGKGNRNSNSSSSSLTYVANFVANTNDDPENTNDNNDPSDSDIFNGSATPFTPAVGACDNGTYGDDDLVVALNREQYGSDQISEYCNSCIKVTGDIGEVVLTVVDVCDGCGEDNLDIATGAFNQIMSDPALGDITWQFVDC